MLISFIFRYGLFKYFSKGLIERLSKSISLRIISRGIISRNVILCDEPLHLSGCERLSIVGCNTPRNPKTIYNMSLQEVDDVVCLHFS
jgi:hypothetical protein